MKNPFWMHDLIDRITGPFARLEKLTSPIADVAKLTAPIEALSKLTSPIADVAKLTAPIADLAKLTAPIVNVPKFTIPIVNVPKFTAPIVSLPKFTISIVNVPKFTIPIMSLPRFTIPIVNVPKLTAPIVNVPKFTIPIVNIPKFTNPMAGIEGLSKALMGAEKFAAAWTSLQLPLSSVWRDGSFAALLEAAKAAANRISEAVAQALPRQSPYAQALIAVQTDDIAQLKEFTTKVLDLPAGDVALVALALFDGGMFGLRDGTGGWQAASNPRAYLRMVVRRLKARAIQEAKFFEGDSAVASMEEAAEEGKEPSHPGIDLLRWAFEARTDITRVSNLKELALSEDAKTVLFERANGLTRSQSGADRLGWTLRRLERAWKELQRALPELQGFLSDYWN
jgi:hypothetical protein